MRKELNEKWTNELFSGAPRNFRQGKAFKIDNEIYICGSTVYTQPGYTENAILVYNIVSNSWRIIIPSEPQNQYRTIEMVNNIIYFICPSDNKDPKKVVAYNPKTNSWTTKASAPLPQFSAASGVYGNNIYIVGGHDRGVTNGKVIYYNNIYRYNTVTNSWHYVNINSHAEDLISSYFYKDELVLIDGRSNLRRVRSYNVNTNKWTEKKSCPFDVRSDAYTIHNENFYSVNPIGDLYKYEYEKDIWSKCDKFKEALDESVLVSLENNIYAMGGTHGTNSGNNPSNTIKSISLYENINEGFNIII